MRVTIQCAVSASPLKYPLKTQSGSFQQDAAITPSCGSSVDKKMNSFGHK